MMEKCPKTWFKDLKRRFSDLNFKPRRISNEIGGKFIQIGPNWQSYDIFKAPRAAQMGPAGCMRPAGRTLATPVIAEAYYIASLS